MVFSSVLLATVATVSADLCQYIACNPQRLSSEEVLDLICCFPLQQLRRIALCVWSFFCFPPPDSYPFSSSDSDSSDSYSESDDSHSDWIQHQQEESISYVLCICLPLSLSLVLFSLPVYLSIPVSVFLLFWTWHLGTIKRFLLSFSFWISFVCWIVWFYS